jgi:hypothetical protein
MIGLLAHGHVSEKPRAGQPFFDRLGQSLCDHDVGLARLAGELGPDVLEHDQRGGNIFELFAEFLADALAKHAAIGASSLLRRDVVDDPLASQAGRQGLSAVTLDGRLGGRGRRRFGSRFGLGRDLGRAGLEELAGEEQELIGVELLGLLAIEPLEEKFELVLEFLVEVGLLVQALEQLADEPVGGLDILGQWGVGVDVVMPSIRTKAVDVTVNLQSNMRDG